MRLNQSLVTSLIATCFITLTVVAEEHPGMRASTCYLKKEKRDHYHYSDRRETKTISSYNRVDGLFLGMRVPYHKDYRGNGVLQLYGMVGVGIKSKAIRYRAALERGLFPYSYRFALGFEAYDLTYSEDDWIISTLENSLAAFFIHEDFQDFYRRQGYGVYLRQNFSQHLSLKVGYYEEKHSYLPLKTDWALFGGHKKFRPNPSITEGELKGILTTLCFDTRNHYKNPDQGWLATIFIEYTPKDFLNQTDDLDFKRYIIDIRRYQPYPRVKILTCACAWENRMLHCQNRNSLTLVALARCVDSSSKNLPAIVCYWAIWSIAWTGAKQRGNPICLSWMKLPSFSS